MTKKHNDFNGQTLSGYGICFYTDYVFNFSPGTLAYHAIIFDADNPGHEGNVKFNNKTTSVSASYGKTNISRTKNALVLSIHYNRKIAIFLQMVKKWRALQQKIQKRTVILFV